MPNYGFQINTSFKPTSFQEYIQPLMMAQQRHDQLEDTLSQYDAKAAEFMRYANNTTDKEEIAKYTAYANQLQEAANTLATQGIKGVNRGSMWGIKQQYNNSIAPLISAGLNRNAIIKEQRQLKAQDPTMIFDDASTEALKTFVDNPNYTYTPYSGKMIMAISAQAADRLATTDRATLLKHLTPYQIEYVKQHGYDKESVLKVIKDSPDKDALLSEVIDSTMNTTGITPKQKELYKQGKAYAIQGLWHAIGQDAVQTFVDTDHTTQYNADVDVASKEKIMKNNIKMGLNPDGSIPKNLNMTDDPTAGIDHWGDEIAANPELKSVYDTTKRVMSQYGNTYRGANSAYFEDSKGKYVNPMKVYEEAEAYAKKHPKNENVGSYSNNRGVYSYGNRDISLEEALPIITKKYGVAKTLSTTDYNNLKALGYTSQSTWKSFSGTAMSDRANKQGAIYRNSSVNMANYTNATEKISTNFNNWENNDNFAANVYAYDKGKKGKQLDIDDIGTKQDDGSYKFNISRISYSMRNPTMLLANIGGKECYINPTAISSEAYQKIQAYAKAINATNDVKVKSDLQDTATKELSILLNNYQKTRSETDANI